MQRIYKGLKTKRTKCAVCVIGDLRPDQVKEGHQSTYLIFVSHASHGVGVKTSQELRMLSSVTINCQITKIVMNSGSQLVEL